MGLLTFQFIKEMPGGGAGYIAGEPTTGITDRLLVPESMKLELRTWPNGLTIRTLWSDAGGEYRFDGLDPNLRFEVICRDPTEVEQDQIKSRIYPIPY